MLPICRIGADGDIAGRDVVEILQNIYLLLPGKLIEGQLWCFAYEHKSTHGVLLRHSELLVCELVVVC